MDFESVIRNRYATRKYREDKVEKELLEKVLEAGRLAPTAKNLQPIKIYVVEKELAKIDKASPCRYGAPTVLMVCGDIEQAFQKENHNTGEMDSCIVATHMMLEAANLGLGSIWIEMFDEQVLREEFDLPDNLVPICLIPIGYAAEDSEPNPNHFKRKPLEEIVEYC